MTKAFQVGGSVAEDSFYAERQADKDLYQALQAGELCYVFNSRQMGKSSLLLHCKSRLQRENYRCCFIDVSRIGSVNIESLQWYAGMLSELWRGMGLPAGKAMVDWWQQKGDIPPPQKLGLFLMEELSSHYPEEEIVIFLDEVDSVLSLPFAADDFFSVIRACYNRRPEDSRLKKINFAFFGVALPTELIRDPSRTPFNIGRAIRMEGFSSEEAGIFEQGLHIGSTNPRSILQRILWWSGGQPFLTQKLCQLVASYRGDLSGITEVDLVNTIVTGQVLDNWEANDNPEHLRTIRDRIRHDKKFGTKVLAQYLQILDSENNTLSVKETGDYSHLYLTGLIAEQYGKITLRSLVYETIFDRRWVLEELRNQRPYEHKLSLWEESGQKVQWLLQGNELINAREWAQDKHLPELDHRFLAASQELESTQFQQWNEQLQKEIDQRRRTEAQLQEVLAELKVAKGEAESANQAKSEFLARVSHEVRTHINSVLGLSYIARQQDYIEVGRDYLEKIQRAANYLLGVVNSMVDISKIEKGELQLNHEAFSFDDVLDNLIDVIGLRIYEEQLRFDIKLPNQVLPLLMGDPFRLEQLLFNLLLFSVTRCQGKNIRLDVTSRKNGSGRMLLNFAVFYAGELAFKDDTLSPAKASTQTADKIVGLVLLKKLTKLMGGEFEAHTSKGTEEKLENSVCTELNLKLCFDISTSDRSALHTRTPKKYRIALCFGKNCDEPGYQNSDAATRMITHLQLIGYEGQVFDLSSTATRAFKDFDVLLADQSSLEKQSRLLSVLEANPGVKLIPMLPTGMRIPHWLIVLDIQHKLDYPYSLSRLRSVINASQLEPVSQCPVLDRIIDQPYDILVAEDDEINQLIVSELLQSIGLKADVVSNGQEAVEAVSNKAYHLILMDIEMPVMGGIEAVRKIRALATTEPCCLVKTLPIIAMTAHALIEDRKIFMHAGMNDYLSKPLDPEALVQVIQQWLPDVQSEKAASESDVSVYIPNVDCKAGLLRCGGNLKLYLEVLKQFARKYRRGVAVEGQKLPIMAATYHTIKGSSANLGANQISAIAAELEACARRGDIPAQALADKLSAQLISFSESIFQLSSTEVTDAEITKTDPQRQLQQLEKFVKALDNDHAEAEQILASVSKVNEPDLSTVENAMAIFDIDKARELSINWIKKNS